MKTATVYFLYIILIFQFIYCSPRKEQEEKNTSQNKETKEINFSGNPILPGDFADPFIVVYRDTFYIYATTGNESTVWYSPDFIDWKLTKLNWPTSMRKPDIWAPAVTRGVDGKFYFYPSVDHNIYVGVADHPKGPFKNVLGGDKIFIKNRQYWNNIHSIDADCFIDTDGQAYLYWGSGFDFKDGICAVGKLGKDMASFTEPPKLITPESYFEGPHMLKRKDKYYLMYSDSLFYDSTYKVRYAISDSPKGPFKEGKNSPILSSIPDEKISGPGHHSTFNVGDDYYIVYHRHAFPLYAPYWGPIRQVCVDKLEFEEDGSMKRVKATQKGIPLDFVKNANASRVPLKPVATTSSQPVSADFDADNAFDNNYGTLWASPKKGLPAWLTADFGKEITIRSCSPLFDIVMSDYQYRIEYSSDGKTWQTFAEGDNSTAKEWPVEHKKEVKARFLKITISKETREPNRVGLWELKVY